MDKQYYDALRRYEQLQQDTKQAVVASANLISTVIATQPTPRQMMEVAEIQILQRRAFKYRRRLEEERSKVKRDERLINLYMSVVVKTCKSIIKHSIILNKLQNEKLPF